MKRDLSKLNKRDIIGIKKWLKLETDKPGYCPFCWRDNLFDNWALSVTRKCQVTCEKIFPTLHKDHCPCFQFKNEYVTKVFKDIVKQWEAK